MLRQVGERESFFRPFQFDEILIQLDTIFTVMLDGEAQKSRSPEVARGGYRAPESRPTGVQPMAGSVTNHLKGILP